MASALATTACVAPDHACRTSSAKPVKRRRGACDDAIPDRLDQGGNTRRGLGNGAPGLGCCREQTFAGERHRAGDASPDAGHHGDETGAGIRHDRRQPQPEIAPDRREPGPDRLRGGHDAGPGIRNNRREPAEGGLRNSRQTVPDCSEECSEAIEGGSGTRDDLVPEGGQQDAQCNHTGGDEAGGREECRKCRQQTDRQPDTSDDRLEQCADGCTQRTDEAQGVDQKHDGLRADIHHTEQQPEPSDQLEHKCAHQKRVAGQLSSRTQD